MKNLLVVLYFIILLLLANACIIGKSKYENFIRDYIDTNTNLKLNGYYYFEFESKKNSIKYVHSIFLYKDGTVYSSANVDAYIYSDPNKILLKDNTYENVHKNLFKFLKSHLGTKLPRAVGWGQYRVINDTLVIKYFIDGPSNMGDRTLCESKCIILSDTSFMQLNLSCLDKYEIKEERIYKFRQHSWKPDSVNWTQDF